jgi:hypothetical protein
MYTFGKKKKVFYICMKFAALFSEKNTAIACLKAKVREHFLCLRNK